jgi:hypothetical protein
MALLLPKSVRVQKEFELYNQMESNFICTILH